MKKWQKLDYKIDRKKHPSPLETEVWDEKLKIVLQQGILKKKFSTPNFTKFLNP